MINILKDEICKIAYSSSLVNVEKYQILDIDGQIGFNFSFINSTKKAISKLILCVVCYSEDNKRIGVQQNVQVVLNQENVESTFSSNENIMCDFPETKIIVPLIATICLSDGQVIKNDLSKLQPVKIEPQLIDSYNEELKDVLILELETRKVPNKKYVYCTYNDFWQCTCGAVNNQSTCLCCGTNKALLDIIFNEDKLREKKANLLNDQSKELKEEIILNEPLEELALEEISEEEIILEDKTPKEIIKEESKKKSKKDKKEANPKQKSKKKKLAIIIPIVVVLVAAIALGAVFIPRIIERKNNILYNGTLDNYNVKTSGEEIIITKIKEVPSNGVIEIPNGVTGIGEYAFKDVNAKGIIVPDTITKIEKYAFMNSTIKSIILPDSVNSIGYGAFYNCANLEKITIPTHIKKIENGTFSLCKNLMTVVLPKDLEEIGVDAFRDCNSLFSIVNKSNLDLSKIGNGGIMTHAYEILDDESKSQITWTDNYCVFNDGENKTLLKYNCENSTIIIPDDITDIEYNAFDGCVDDTCFEGSANIVSKLAYTNIEGPYSVKITSGTAIEFGAFYGCAGLTSVEIPNSITSIGDEAFYGCGLTNITIPDSVTSIGEAAFSYCSSLTSIIIPNSVKRINYRTFEECSSLTSVTIGDGVTAIGDKAFAYCASLTSVIIPSSVTIIGEGAFYECDELTSIAIPNSVTSIEDTAFFGCSKLEYNEYDNAYYLGNATNPYYVLMEAKSIGITSCEISDQCKLIVGRAFYDCDNLTSIIIPDGVITIGDFAFGSCDELKSISIPNSVTNIGHYVDNNCSKLEYNEYDNAYYLGNSTNPYLALIKAKNTSITTCEISDQCKLIVGSAFYNCDNLTSVEIPNSITSIGDEAFYGCGLTNITIPDSVTSIGEAAFSYCSSLTSIIIPNSVKSIGDYAFEFCTGLTSISIGKGLTKIGEGVFVYCTGLTSINVDSENSKYHSEGNCLIETETKTLILGCKTSVIPTDGSVEIIGEGAFVYCNGLTSITIPKSVTVFREAAFCICYDLETINYAGTKAEWELIAKGRDWDLASDNYSIVCTDGTIEK